MKTWTLVWFLILNPTDDGTAWEAGVEHNLTEQQCEQMRDEQDLDYILMQKKGEIQGHNIYCKDQRGKKVPVIRL